MSIATELTALNTNLTTAKAAVTAAGGTVGDTGLAGLASEIGTIPSGGGNSGPKIKFTPIDSVSCSLGTNGTQYNVQVVNSEKLYFNFYVPMNRIWVTWDQSRGTYIFYGEDVYSMMDPYFTTWEGTNAECIANFGLDFSQSTGISTDSMSPTMFDISATVTKGAVVEDTYQFQSFLGSTMMMAGVFTDNYGWIPTSYIEEIELPEYHGLPTKQTNSSYTTLFNGLTNVRKIKLLGNFEYYAQIFGSLTNLEEIDVGNYEFIPHDISAYHTDVDFSMNSSGPAYTNGVLVTGAKAQQFVTRFPNLDGVVIESGRYYRKFRTE